MNTVRCEPMASTGAQRIASKPRDRTMRNLFSAAVAAALLTGCPLEQAKIATSSEGDAAMAKQVASAVQARMPAAPSARAPGAAQGGVVQALGVGPTGAAAASPLATAVRPPNSDANADGRSDMFWLGGSSGTFHVAHWRMNGATILQMVGATVLPEGNYSIFNGDFDGDRRVDQIWFNPDAGNRRLLLARQDANGILAPTFVAGVGGAWLPSAVEDLNGDGKSDIVWVDKTRGQMAYWLMNGTAIAGSAVFGVDTANYDFLGRGDFNGDGRGDLLWLGHRTNGPLYMWRGRADGQFDQVLVGNLSIAFQFYGTTDLNGDGRSDIVFTSYTGRSFAYWLMSGDGVLQGGTIPIDRDRFEIAGVGDYDGDGKGDVMWTTKAQREDALLYLWRGRGDGSFDSTLVAQYDHSIWVPFQRQ
ncbi:VCBS repeat-containing protein [Lysobacter sp. Root604]|uniref:FG-GAP repeat domain-containing protein n=1 Tax=Lysobacter sp. Root604 TaxID=1736568 RepID=UPI0012F8929D|nr:VCBS repeat-containing protein [Lysobacter sp. Root604]